MLSDCNSAETLEGRADGCSETFIEKRHFTGLYEITSWLNIRDDAEDVRKTKAWYSRG